MSVLTDAQVVTIAEAGVLLPLQASVLSEFEQELVREICARFLRCHRDTIITPAEWAPFSDAVAAMRLAERMAAARDAERSRAAFLAATRAA